MKRLVVILALASCHGEDDCDRALARQARITASHHEPRLSNASAQLFLDECRDGKASQWDPALRCLLSSPTDDAADACLQRFVHDVVRPGAPGAPAGGGGKGLNPLLDPDD